MCVYMYIFAYVCVYVRISSAVRSHVSGAGRAMAPISDVTPSIHSACLARRVLRCPYFLDKALSFPPLSFAYPLPLISFSCRSTLLDFSAIFMSLNTVYPFSLIRSNALDSGSRFVSANPGDFNAVLFSTFVNGSQE